MIVPDGDHLGSAILVSGCFQNFRKAKNIKFTERKVNFRHLKK